jgi:hypothetical protein
MFCVKWEFKFLILSSWTTVTPTENSTWSSSFVRATYTFVPLSPSFLQYSIPVSFIYSFCRHSSPHPASLCSTSGRVATIQSISFKRTVTCWSDYRRGFELDIGFIDTSAHNSELQAIAAPPLTSKLYKSPQHPLSLYHSAVPSLVVAW